MNAVPHGYSPSGQQFHRQSQIKPLSIEAMTSSAPTSPTTETQADQLAEKFIECLKEQADALGQKFPDLTPMQAQAMALILVDTLVKLHESGLDEALKSSDAQQATSWTRDLSVLELVISLLRNIQPLDLDESTSSDVQISN